MALKPEIGMTYAEWCARNRSVAALVAAGQGRRSGNAIAERRARVEARLAREEEARQAAKTAHQARMGVSHHKGS